MENNRVMIIRNPEEVSPEALGAAKKAVKEADSQKQKILEFAGAGKEVLKIIQPAIEKEVQRTQDRENGNDKNLQEYTGNERE